jgi:hypothetical protein
MLSSKICFFMAGYPEISLESRKQRNYKSSPVYLYDQYRCAIGEKGKATGGK